jgi:hypothetical protein
MTEIAKKAIEEGTLLEALPACRGCGKDLQQENLPLADGCPCNYPRGINHGIVPMEVCTCTECDPQQTGSSRFGRPLSEKLHPVIALPDWKRDCLYWWKEVLAGTRAHWCPNWDFLPIDETRDEIKSCTCLFLRRSR